MWPCPLTPGQRQQRGHGAALCTLGSSSMSWKVGPRLKGITGRDFGGFISHPLLPRGCPTKTMACEAGFPPGPGGDVTCPGWGCHLPWVGVSPPWHRDMGGEFSPVLVWDQTPDVSGCLQHRFPQLPTRTLPHFPWHQHHLKIALP